MRLKSPRFGLGCSGKVLAGGAIVAAGADAGVSTAGVEVVSCAKSEVLAQHKMSSASQRHFMSG